MSDFIKNLVLPRWKYVLGGLAVVVIGGYLLFGRGSNLGPTLLITPGDFREQVRVSGAVVAAQDVDLGFAANGRIAGTYAHVGQHVEVGDILAQTENGDLAAALEEAQANLASLKAGTRPEELAVAAAAVTSAQQTLLYALQSAYTTSDDAIHNKVDSFFTTPRTDPKLLFTVGNLSLKTAVEQERAAIEPTLASWKLLVASLTNANAADSATQAQAYLKQIIALLVDANAALNQGIADQNVSAATLASFVTTLGTARSNVNSAASTLSADMAALDSAQKNLALKQAGSTPENIAAQEAAVAAAKAALAKTRVVAPFSGVVTRMDAKVGEIVAPATSEISMQSDGVFQIETYIPEIVIARVAAGNPATTTLDAYGTATEFPATVIAVDPAETVKDGVPTYKTTLSFLAPDSRIRSGMTANVVIETGVLHNAIVVPTGAVAMKNGKSYVSVAAHNAATARPVTVGPSPSLGQTEILSGLSAGDTILLSPVP